MSGPREYEWFRDHFFADSIAANRTLSWDIGPGTLIRLIYEVQYMSSGAAPDPWEQQFFLGVWAIDDVAPDPLATGVDPETVLERHCGQAWDPGAPSMDRTPPVIIAKDFEVRRVIGDSDLLWWSVDNGISGMGFWQNVMLQALVLRP